MSVMQLVMSHTYLYNNDKSKTVPFLLFRIKLLLLIYGLVQSK